MELYDRVPRELSAEKIDLARTICRFAALAVDTARLFKKERALTERRDRLARRLQRLQSFAVELNRRLDRADEQEILDEVVAAAADLLHVRAAAVLSGVGEYTVVRASTGVAEEELLERYRSRALGVPADLVPADDEVLPAGVSQDDDLLMVPVDPESMGKTSMLVVSGSSDGEFDDEDELLITTLAAQLGASLHNAMAYQREHAIAETFQEALLQEPPFVAGVEMGVRYRAATDAARIGGDFYDLVMLAPGKLMVTVGDVCGKGLGAAAHSATVRYMLRAYVAEGSPGRLSRGSTPRWTHRRRVSRTSLYSSPSSTSSAASLSTRSPATRGPSSSRAGRNSLSPRRAIRRSASSAAAGIPHTASCCRPRRGLCSTPTASSKPAAERPSSARRA